MLRILITDGANKNTLSILRHLNHNEFQIDITTHLPKILTLCSYSKYCRNTIKLNSDHQNIDSYAKEIIHFLKKGNYDVFIPVGLESNLVASKYKTEIQSFVNLVVPDWEYMKIAANKDMTMNLASSLGVPIPKTLVLDNPEDLDNITKFPVVIKSSDGSKDYVKYCNDSHELLEKFTKLSSKSKTRIICQEYVEGFGCGFFGIYYNGKLISHFLHKRVKEFPITGGTSAVAESFFDEKLYIYGKQLGDALHWNGPIMAEFKYDAIEKEYKLIEINPKLWGSLDLTIEAGINIPQILIQIALNKEINSTSSYRYIKYRWVFPDEFKVLVSKPSIRAIREFMTRKPETMTNICITDPLPTIIQIARSFIEGFAILLNENAKYPHGRKDNDNQK